MTIDYQSAIDEAFQAIMSLDNLGEAANYIPELGKVNPNQFGVCLTTPAGNQFVAGNHDIRFSIQSISKVLSLTMAFDLLGERVWERVGVEPSGTAFNSLVQLESEAGIPRNPFINAGAIVISDMLCSELKQPKEEFISYLREIANNPSIDYDAEIAESEKSEGYRNFALINFLKSFGNIKNDVEQVIDFYFYLSSIKMDCQELATTFLFLANRGLLPGSEKRILSVSKAKRVKAILLSCGFYDESGEFAYKVGLPGKSGVGGGIVAVLPGQYSIAVWSPRLNDKGNSYRGMRFLELFTTKTETSIF